MHRSLMLAITIAAHAGAAVADEVKDPKTLNVPAVKTATAKALIARWDDDNQDVRDKATADLKAMGRDALPALLVALNGKPSNEVQNRLEGVLPAARKADFDTRAECFLADRDRKFDHDLLGWSELKRAVKDTKESRRLFADILADAQCRGMLLLAVDPTGRKQFEKRWAEKYDEWTQAGRRDGAGVKADEPIRWLGAALLADLLHGGDYRDYSRSPVVWSYARTDEGKLAVVEKGEYGGAISGLALHWIQQQTGRFGLEDAKSVAETMKFGNEVKIGCLERSFELFVKTGERDGSLGQLAATRDPKYIPSIRRLFESSAIHRPEGQDVKTPEIQVRDAALAMCVVLSGQEPSEYGFSAQVAASEKEPSLRYWAENYSFEAGGGKTADEKRTAAFKKWAEWEKANPDKIKAKAPDKK